MPRASKRRGITRNDAPPPKQPKLCNDEEAVLENQEDAVITVPAKQSRKRKIADDNIVDAKKVKESVEAHEELKRDETVGSCEKPSSSRDSKDSGLNTDDNCLEGSESDSPNEVEKESLEIIVSDEEDIEDRFVIGNILGKGVSGVVYEAYDYKTDRTVALKLLEREDVDFVEKGNNDLPMEACLQAKLDHPNVLKVYGVLQSESKVGLFLERPLGFLSLREFFDNPNNHINSTVVKKIFKGILDGVIHCLERKVFHQDLSLRNILVHPVRLEVKIIDFGCAAEVEEEGHIYIAANRQATPPEYWGIDKWLEEMVWDGVNISDLEGAREYLAKKGQGPVYANHTYAWACGAMLYHILTKKWVYKGPAELDVNKLLFPKGFRRLLAGLLEENPTERMSLQRAKRIISLSLR